MIYRIVFETKVLLSFMQILKKKFQLTLEIELTSNFFIVSYLKMKELFDSTLTCSIWRH